MRTLTVPVVALALAAAAGPAQAAPPSPSPPGAPTPAAEVVEKGVGFTLPSGFTVVAKQEAEPHGDEDTVHVARRGLAEVRAEVEDGPVDCRELPGATPRTGKSATGLKTCEAEGKAPPALGPEVAERRAALVAVQFPGRHLSVMAFAADGAEALRLARAVAASARSVP